MNFVSNRTWSRNGLPADDRLRRVLRVLHAVVLHAEYRARLATEQRLPPGILPVENTAPACAKQQVLHCRQVKQDSCHTRRPIVVRHSAAEGWQAARLIIQNVTQRRVAIGRVQPLTCNCYSRDINSVHSR